MSKNIAVVGGGGFAKEVIEVAKMLGYSIHGIFAQESSLGDFEYRGYLEELNQQKDSFDGVIVAVGAVNRQGIKNRAEIIEFIDANDIPLISVISPLATIAKSVKIAKGVYIGHNVLISCDTEISQNVLINHNACIGHDCLISTNVSIGPQVFLGGGVVIKSDVIVGVGATVMQGIEIGENSLIGMRSVVMKRVKPNSMTIHPPSKIYSV